MVYCQAFGCKNATGRGLNKSFHKPELFKKWAAAIKVVKFLKTDYKYNRNDVICSDHFTADDWEVDMRARLTGSKARKMLKEHAVPSVFSHRPATRKLTASSSRISSLKFRKKLADLNPSLAGNSTTVKMKEACEASTTVRIKEEYETFSDDGKELPKQPWAQVNTSHQPGQSLTRYEVKIETIQGDDASSASDNEEFATHISKHDDYEDNALSVTGGELIESVSRPDSEGWYNSEDTLIKAQHVDEEVAMHISKHDDYEDGSEFVGSVSSPDSEGWYSEDTLIEPQHVDEGVQSQVLDANPKDCDDCEDSLIEAQCENEDTMTQVLDAINPKDCDDGDDIQIEAQCVDEDNKTRALDANSAELEDTWSIAQSGHGQRSNPGLSQESVLRQPVSRTGLASGSIPTGTVLAGILKATAGLPTDETVPATPAAAQDSGLDKHQCKECGNQFSQPIFLARHLKVSHGFSDVAPTRDTLKSDAFNSIENKRGLEACNSSDVLTGEQIYTEPSICDQCGKTFDEAGNLSKHKCTHAGKKTNACDGKALSQAGNLSIKTHIHTSEEPSHKNVCNQCGKSFRDGGRLAIHKRSHTGEKPYACDQCGRAFSQASNLTTHKRVHTGQRRIHTGEKPYPCDECGKAFSEGGHLRAHMRIHTGEKPYVCDLCGKAFNQGSHLTLHKRSHTGEKPFECDECGKAFVESARLTRHKKQVHLGEKPSYKCDECGKSYSQAGLTDHKRIHTGEKPFVCDQCGKAFSNKSNLAKHKHIHTGQKPHVCNECGKAFTAPGVLIAHKRVHTIGKPYVCDQCGRGFRYESGLSKHTNIYSCKQP